MIITGRRAEPLDALAGGRPGDRTSVRRRGSGLGHALAAHGRQGDLDPGQQRGGRRSRGSLVEINVEEWDEVFDINVRGVFLICKAFLPPWSPAAPVT